MVPNCSVRTSSYCVLVLPLARIEFLSQDKDCETLGINSMLKLGTCVRIKTYLHLYQDILERLQEKEKELESKENLLKELQWCKEQSEEAERAAKKAAAMQEAEEKRLLNEKIQKYKYLTFLVTQHFCKSLELKSWWIVNLASLVSTFSFP